MSEDVTRFDDIDGIIREASELDLDIYDKMIRICSANGRVRPISIYVALLEDGKTYALELENPRIELRMSCLTDLIKLAEFGLFTCELDDGFYTEHTAFKPNKYESIKFNHFLKLIHNAMRELDADRYSDIGIEAKDRSQIIEKGK
ncbi:MAG: hypothetical protein EHM20_06395 [Alphaproteobacteria bacterium]|nr:MAG: hypothetical protein EHM20_06395 [Alphaproteobacteria bacterium]